MASSGTFTGIGLSIQSAAANSGAKIVRVRFTNEPKRISTSGANDALNVANYSIVGPGFVTITGASSVVSDAQSVDLTLASPLTTGEWVCSIQNIQTVGGVLCVPPLSVVFSALGPTVQPLNPGSEDSEKIIRKHLNPALAGPGWDALIDALSVGDEHNFYNAERAFDQLYTASANGKYLERQAGNVGVSRPLNVGLLDDDFRKYIIKYSNKKVVNQAILEMLEVFYGQNALRAHTTTEGFEPFALADGDDLNVTIDGVDKTNIVFKSNFFTNIAQAKATEVAASITRAFLEKKSKAFALAFTDYDGKRKVRIYSPSLGLRGSVRIQGSGGGKAQNALGFSTPLSGSVYTGTITPTPVTPEIPLGVPCVSVSSRSPSGQLATQKLVGAKFADGRCVVLGGLNNQTGTVVDARADIYSDDGHSVIALPNVPFNGRVELAVRLGNNKILVVGYENNTWPLKSALLDPNTLTWTAGPTCAALFTKSYSDVVALADGNALFIGGEKSPGGDHNSVFLFDYATNTWIEKTAYITPAEFVGMKGVLLQDGNVLVTGGKSVLDSSYTSVAAVYNPVANTWTATGNSITGRSDHAVGVLENGIAIVTGGDSDNPEECFWYDPQTNLFTQKADLPVELSHTTPIFKLENNYMCMIGGLESGNTFSDKIYTYNPNLDTWASTSVLGQHRADHIAFYQGACSFLVVGGASTQKGGLGQFSTNSAEFINLTGASSYVGPKNNWSWSNPINLSQARTNPAVVRLNTGEILVIGGADRKENPTAVYNSVEIIAANQGSVSSVANLPWSAQDVSAALLTNGNVLAWGGRGLSAPSTQAAVYDPSLDTWTTISNQAVSLSGSTTDFLTSTGTENFYDLPSTEDFTFSFDIKRAVAGPEYKALVNKETSTGGWSIFLLDDELVCCLNDTTNPVLLATTGGSLANTDWHSITFLRASGQYEIWIDGTMNTSLVSGFNPTSTSNVLQIGHRPQYSPFAQSVDSAYLEEGLVGYWDLQNDSDDVFGGAYDAVSTNITYDGSDATFNASNSSIIIPSGAGLDITTDLTISVWCYPTAHADYFSIVNHMGGGGGANNVNYHLIMFPSGQIGLHTQSDTGPNGPSLNLSVWTHIVVTRTASGFVQFFKNGVLTHTGQGNAAYSKPAATTQFGSRADAYSYWHGSLRQVGIWSRCLAPDEVNKMYNTSSGRYYPLHTISKSELNAGLLGFWRMNGDATDYLGLNNGSGSPFAYVDGYTDQAAQFDGSTVTLVDLADADTLKPTSAITVSGWIKVNTIANNNRPINDWHSNVTTNRWYFLQNSNKLNFGLSINNGAETPVVAFTAGNTDTGNWHHYVGTYDGATGEVKTYYDGVLANTYTTGVATPNALNTGFGAGNYITLGGQSGAGGILDGEIQDVGLWNRALSDTEVEDLYASGAADVAFKKIKYIKDGDQVADWELNGSLVDASSTAQDLAAFDPPPAYINVDAFDGGLWDNSVATGSDGTVYTIGGRNSLDLSDGAIGDVKKFDEGLGSFVTLEPLPLQRAGAASAVYNFNGNDQIVVMGGYTSNTPVGTVVAYNVNANTWTNQAASTPSLYRAQLIVEPTGGALLLGGASDESGNPSSSSVCREYGWYIDSFATNIAGLTFVGKGSAIAIPKGVIYLENGNSFVFDPTETEKTDLVSTFAGPVDGGFGLIYTNSKLVAIGGSESPTVASDKIWIGI